MIDKEWRCGNCGEASDGSPHDCVPNLREGPVGTIVCVCGKEFPFDSHASGGYWQHMEEVWRDEQAFKEHRVLYQLRF